MFLILAVKIFSVDIGIDLNTMLYSVEASFYLGFDWAVGRSSNTSLFFFKSVLNLIKTGSVV